MLTSTHAHFLSCEHAGNNVPAPWKWVFEGHEHVLETHEGWDPGAYDLALYLANALRTPLLYEDETRLLVEPNRAENLWSRFTEGLPALMKEMLLERVHRPYLQEAERIVADQIAFGRHVTHLSIHTFTPSLDGVERDVDVSVLCDPTRQYERYLSLRIIERLHATLPELRIGLNTPYDGRSDCIIAYLRSRYPRYTGLALEAGQGLLLSDGTFPRKVKQGIAGAYASAVLEERLAA